MLLGQYSDDEVDEESVEVLKRAASEDSSLDHEDKGKHSGDDETNVNGEIGSTVMEVEEKAIDNGSDLLSPSDRPAEDSARENNASVSVDLHAQLSVLDQITAPTTSDAQALGDASAGWKMVLHEESNQYYYWNTVTGETSWEVPQILGHAVEQRLEEKVTAETECMGRTTLENLEPSAKMDMDTRQTSVSYSDINEYRKPTDDDLHDKKRDNDEDQSGTINGFEQIDSQCNEISSPDGSLSSGKSDHAPEGNLNGPGEDFTKCSDADYVPEGEAEADFSSDLVKHCERLLKQLETMKGSEFYVQYDRISKYALELEIRLADIRSLACNGLSLLPFWVHSERKIKLLDSEINQLCGLFLSGQQNDVEADHVSHRGSDNVNDANGESSSCPATTGDASEESGATGVHEDLTPQTVLHPAEEVDMDVDMEVEDTEPSEQQTKLESSILEQTPNVPPPPDEDWIPPPPPDNEPFLPPPPDEPVDHTHAVPSNMESVQSFPYNLAYPGSTFDYYGQTNPEIASSLYGTSDGQIAVTHHPLYYQIPTTYSVTPVAINHVDPSAYYGHQDGALQPVSVVSGTESSGLPAIPVHETVAPDATPSLDVNKGSRSDLSAKSEADVPADLENEKIYFDVPATQSSLATETVSAMEGVGVSSTSVASGAVATASTAPSKVPSKVLRKKRTVGVVSTLRSNKKVSSLVDKWKAAKEELHAEEEEERESALDKLEKKRQREIEEWRAQQIASGEAKDNANFQPLGGDWYHFSSFCFTALYLRERVKRKRVEKMREAEKQLSEENEQPDLDVISRGLPSGWKAYWDDSTKQVYYGKAVTSETSWNRPTN
uniref:WW domain-containing protein n=1 Tax=Solanum lycopersicum TaxID=4081 RepID=A0A3Q7IAW7_SOLLC